MFGDYKNRDISLDFVRIIATIAVITIHVTGLHWMEQDLNSFAWDVHNIYRALVRWAVPVFVMLSGALFLNPQKELSLKKIYTKNIIHIVTAFLSWSFLYAVYDFDGNILDFLINWIRGAGHMWFVFLILGLYIILPVLRFVSRTEKILYISLILCLLFGFVMPMVFESIPLYIGQEPLVSGKMLFLLKIMQKGFGWVGYYLLGCALTHYRIGGGILVTTYIWQE